VPQPQLAQKITDWIKQNRTPLLFGCLHVLIFTFFFKSGWIFGKFLQDDFTLSYYYSSRIMLGQLPYRDFAVEYPPLALVCMILPRLFSANPDVYADLFNAEMLVFDLIGLLLITAIAKQLGKSLWKTLAVYTLALAAIGPLIVVRYDIIPAIVLLAALYLFLRGHSSWSWAFLAIGALTKIYPLVAVPLLLITQFKKRDYSQILRGIGAFVLTGAIIAIPVLIISPQGLLGSLTYHTGRSLQCETTYASFLLLAQSLGFGSLEIVNSSGSTNVVSPLADALASWSTPIMLLILLVIYWLYYRRLSREVRSAQVAGATSLINFFFMAVLVFVLSYKVFSPQFIIWFFPLVPLLTTRWGNLPWLIFVMAGLMTAFVYPKDYGGLEYGEMLAIGMLVLRNAALIVLAVLVIRGEPKAGLRPGRSPRVTRPSADL
jgi:uncharacterized membrane protein